MSVSRAIAAVAASVLVAAVLLVPAVPAVAATEVYINPVQAQNQTDPYLLSFAPSYTAEGFRFDVTTANFDGSRDYSYTVHLALQQSAQPDVRAELTAVSSAGSTSFTVVSTQGGQTTSTPTADASVQWDPQNKTLSMRHLSTVGDGTMAYFAWATVSTPEKSASIGIPLAGGTAGFGPITLDALATTTALSFNAPLQVHGKNPAVAFVTVEPRSAVGEVQILDGKEVIASAYRSRGDQQTVIDLPKDLATKRYQLTARFVPSYERAFIASTSAGVPFEVESAGPRTTTKVSKSASTQRYKKTSVTLTARVKSSKAKGSVVFYDISDKAKPVKLKTVKLKKGKAAYTLSKKLKPGKHSIKAEFVPKNAEAYKRSAKTVTVVVKR